MARPKKEGAGENFSIRLPAELRARLKRAAGEKGRTLNHEIRGRLIRSFDIDKRIVDAFGDARTYAYFRLLSLTLKQYPMDEEGRRASRRPHWLDDRTRYIEVTEAIKAIIDDLAPPAHRGRPDAEDERACRAIGRKLIATRTLSTVKEPAWYRDQLARHGRKRVAQGVLTEEALEELLDVDAERSIAKVLADVLDRASHDLRLL